MEDEKATAAGDAAKLTTDAPRTEPSAKAPVAEVDDAADPDEDDLDDLDDMLDDFSSVKIQPDARPGTTHKNPIDTTATATGYTIPPVPQVPDNLPADEEFSEEDFQKQLQAGMAELMGDLEGSPDLQAQFENIFKGLGASSAPGASEPAGPSSKSKSVAGIAEELSQDATFQETIKRTMERMQNSGDQATAAAAAEGSEEDFIAEMMKAMKDMPGGGEGGDEDFSKLLMGMMEQLTNKEILYEPMKELHEKFPAWMEKNKETLSKDDLKRYQEQQSLATEIVTKFQEPRYSDSNAQDREYIVERMQKMQAAGLPPHDLVGDMPSAKEVLDAPDESCAPQ
ncbi:Pex19 protein family-domain-containing protein [Xylariaceae sp. FL1272]|nr:Pex19 protein family-domain-containing protein [Xylariaceae sp. FL1272]